MPPAKGMWYNPETKEIVKEDPILVHAYASEKDSEDESKVATIGSFCRRMGRETNQGEVALIIDGVFHRMRNFRK